jgi:mono/diheme cytochrome c family protein
MRAFVGVLTVAAAFSFATAAVPTGGQAGDAAKIEAGKAAFTTLKCSQCHAIAGKGGKLSSALDGVGKKLTEADIRKWLTSPAEMEAKIKPKPKAPMSTAMKGKKMTEADIEALVAYMVSLK